MPSLPNPTLTTAILTTWVRQDLNDIGSVLWADAIIARQIDRTVERYTQIAPLYESAQIPTIPFSRLYQAPASALYLESVEYPLGFWPKVFVPFVERLSPKLLDPTIAALGGPSAGGGSLSAGVYQYAYTWVTPGGESLPSPLLTFTATLNGTGNITSLPIGPYGTTARNLYRTVTGGAQLKLVKQIADNFTASTTDTLADGSLGTNAPSTNTTGNIDQFELQLDAGKVPSDTTGTIEYVAAYKHQLDTSGTSIPERHWDALALGTEAYLLYQYLVSTNDNFDYVDGQFRDRVDDTKAPSAWRAQAEQYMARFEHRLHEIQHEQLAKRTPAPQWGDKPVRWDRL